MTQNSPDVTQRARQGDAAAIAILLNHSLRADHITAEAERQGDQLEIRLWGNSPPSPDLVKRVRQGLVRLQPQAIATVVIQGFTANQFVPDWVETIQVTPPAPPTPPPPPNPTPPPATEPSAASPAPSLTTTPDAATTPRGQTKPPESGSALAFVNVIIPATVLALVTAFMVARWLYQEVESTYSGGIWGPSGAPQWAAIYAIPTFFIVLLIAFLAYWVLGSLVIAILRPILRLYRSQRH